MTVHPYVPVDVYNLPEKFEYELDGVTYDLAFDYNDEGDFFVCSIYLEDEPLVLNEKLILNQPLFKNIFDTRLPMTPLTPIDESKQAKRMSIDNFMETVFLCEDVLPDDIDIGELPIESDEGMMLDG